MSYFVFHGDEEVEITCEGFDGLPSDRQSKVIELLGEPIRRDEYCVCFKKGESEAVDSAVEILRIYYRNHSATVRRRSNEMQNSMGVYYPADIRSIYEIQQGKCYFSGEPISLERRDYAIDHLKPVNVCGSSWPENLALVTKEVNLEKRDRTKAQYLNMLTKKHGQEWKEQQKNGMQKSISKGE